MANIIDYLKWRGDVPFSVSPFNQVDNLILSQLSYMLLERISDDFSCDFEISVGEFAKKMLEKELENYSLSPVESDREMLTQLVFSTRFNNSVLTNYVNDIDTEKTKQFAAYTVLLDNGEIFVAYRGTDNTLVGWQEDLNLAFDSAIPAQLESAEYLNNVGKKFEGRIFVGGHSKGGNLAVYASSHCNEQVRSRIVEIFNNDGPGLNDDEMLLPGYTSIQDRLCTLLPQSSVVGMLLAHAEHYSVIKSDNIGLLQHIPYSWQVERTSFVSVDTVDTASSFVDSTLKNLASSLSTEERRVFFESLYDVINATEADTLKELASDKLKSATAILGAMKNLDEKTQKLLFHITGKLFSSGAQSIRDATFEKVNVNAGKIIIKKRAKKQF